MIVGASNDNVYPGHPLQHMKCCYQRGPCKFYKKKLQSYKKKTNYKRVPKGTFSKKLACIDDSLM